MWSRRKLLQSGGLGLCVGGLAWLVSERSTAEERNATLRDTLVFGLRPRLPEDNAFIDLVVNKVELGVLPLEMVIGTYRWASVRKPYPFPFFERAMRQRAAQIGVAL